HGCGHGECTGARSDGGGMRRWDRHGVVLGLAARGLWVRRTSLRKGFMRSEQPRIGGLRSKAKGAKLRGRPGAAGERLVPVMAPVASGDPARACTRGKAWRARPWDPAARRSSRARAPSGRASRADGSGTGPPAQAQVAADGDARAPVLEVAPDAAARSPVQDLERNRQWAQFEIRGQLDLARATAAGREIAEPREVAAQEVPARAGRDL